MELDNLLEGLTFSEEGVIQINNAHLLSKVGGGGIVVDILPPRDNLAGNNCTNDKCTHAGSNCKNVGCFQF